MQVVVNGQREEVAAAMTIESLLVDRGVKKGAACAVEVNRKLVPKREHERTELREGDVVEIVTLVGGG
jgi:sulfur carrier protein